MAKTTMAALCGAAVVGWSTPCFVAPQLLSAKGKTGSDAHTSGAQAGALPGLSSSPSICLALGLAAGSGVALANAKLRRNQRVMRRVATEQKVWELSEAAQWDPPFFTMELMQTYLKDEMAASLAEKVPDAEVAAFWKADAEGKKEVKAKGHPEEVYSRILLKAAQEKKETVAVTKDIRNIRDALQNINAPEFEELLALWLEVEISDDDKAKKMATWLKLESKVAPKWFGFMVKNQRSADIWSTCEAYMNTVYAEQKIRQVFCRTAVPLSDAQVEAIKEKIKKELEVLDVKLKIMVEPELVAGFILEYDFQSEDTMFGPRQEIDMSLSNALRGA